MNSELIRFLRKESGKLGINIALASVIAGLANGMIVVIINSAARNYADFNFRYLVMFILCIALYIVTERYSLFQTAVIVRKAIANTNTRIADKIRHSSLYAYEEIGQARIYNTLSENTEMIFEASRRIASSGSAAVMLTFSFLYIAYLSIEAFWLALIVIVCGVLVYLFNQRSINEELHISTKKESEFFDSLNHVLNGFKELKMNRKKSDDIFYNYIEKISVAARDMRIKTESSFISNIIFAQLFLYILIASIAFVLPQVTSTTPHLIVNIISILLFIIGPLGLVVDAIPVIAKANIAVEKLGSLEAALDPSDDSGQELSEGPLQEVRTVEKITIKRASFSYSDPENRKVFSVGPLDLTINKGEVVFIVGGNGSGKTTLMKLLAGLYYPQGGMLYLNDIPVTVTNYEHYRAFFSIIFTDFHLFDRLYGIDEVDEEKLNTLLNTMELSDKIVYKNNRFSNLNLSTGQKKRLALTVALMEERQVYVLDEVAADQDPVFRKYFYEVLLSELKQQGKTVVAVTHDDRYFHVADRVIKMEYGNIINQG